MQVIPAIDLRGGQVVRLRQGDYSQQTTYSDDPLAVAAQFAKAGATRLHVVDLGGARYGTPSNASVYQRIAREVGVAVQVGGGLRTAQAIEAVLAAGADRVVLGTAAVDDPELVRQAVSFHGADRVVVGLDARDGMMAVKGWTEDTSVPVAELLTRMAGLGVARFIYTDIARDGTLTEPSFDAVADMVRHARQVSATIIASGGISDAEHLSRLAALDVEGAIVGSALYTGALNLAEAIRHVGQP
jgi:phosphoribosylformimino-5-aminoimidazole carboxamide ribotide isomerase